jgi:predicted N-acetyltransferase YhbS
VDVVLERSIDPRPLIELAQSMKWGPPPDEFARRHALDPEGLFLARAAGGEVVGAIQCLTYPSDAGALSWLCNMMVHPSAQRQRIGRRLLRRALVHAAERGARIVGLEATAAARPLYESEGFHAVTTTPRWERIPGTTPRAPPPGPFAIYPISSCEIMELWAFDRPRFGANRVAWLADVMAHFPERSFVAFDRASGAIVGHVLGSARFIGPLVADSPEAAAWLLFACERAGTPPIVHASDWNPRAASVLEAAGYQKTGMACTRMARGGELPGRPETQFGISAWGLG